MKTVKFAMFLFYQYYRSGKWERAPYFHTISSMSFLLFLNIASFLCFLNKGDLLFGRPKNVFIIKFTVVFAMSLFAFWRLATAQKLQKATYETSTVKKGNRALLLYVALSIGMMFLSIAK
jgi:hypothetical protein